MTAIGKLIVVSMFVMALAALTWSTNIYVQRPGWHSDPSTEVDRGNKPVNFKQLKSETETLYKSAAVSSEAWGTHLKALEDREKYRASRRAGYAERIQWAYKGNPKDLIDKDNPKLGGKGFYEPVVDSTTRLYDLELIDPVTKRPDPKGVPKGKAVLGTDGNVLPGRNGLLDSISGDAAAAVELELEIKKQEIEFDVIQKQVRETEDRAIRMGIIRDSVQSELFFLSTFEVNVFETRETVFRRERQLRGRLKGLGVTDP